MRRYIDANAIKLEKGFFEKVDNVPKFYEWLGKQPTVDAVPWEFLERYADWFCASVSFPEFIREAKEFYKSTVAASDGGNLIQRSEK